MIEVSRCRRSGLIEGHFPLQITVLQSKNLKITRFWTRVISKAKIIIKYLMLINKGAVFMEKNENLDFFTKRYLRGVERVLEGEEIFDAIYGSVDRNMMGVKQMQEHAALVLTPTRLILYHNKMFLKGHSSIDFSLQKINSVNLDSGMIHATVKVYSGSDSITVNKLSKIYGERFVKNLKTMISNVNGHTSTTQTSQDSHISQISQPHIDVADQIKKLADLKIQGILTDEEFQAQKRKLLGP
jgi:flagellar hook-basal body complex protein FliE